MADLYNSNATTVALVAATAKTVLQIATPATTRAKIKQLDISFDGVAGSAVPVLIELLMQTTAGTMTAVTPVAVDRAAPASLVTAARNATAEPTAGAVLWAQTVTPAGSTLIFPWPLGDEFKLNVSQFLGVRMTAPAAVNACVTLKHEE